ncbi:MAG: hypothetical protein ACK4NM_02825 [Hydrogenophaga sp.]
MNTPWLVASTTALACFNAQAAGFMFGISHNFGGDTGMTFKILSNERRNRPVLAAGVSFFPGEGRRIGLDLGVGYNFSHTTVTFSRDLIMDRFQMAWGPASRRCPPAPAPVAAPPAPPPPPDFFDSTF